MGHEQDAKALITLSWDSGENDTLMRAYLKGVSNKDDLIIFLAGWVAGYFSTQQEWQEYLLARQADV